VSDFIVFVIFIGYFDVLFKKLLTNQKNYVRMRLMTSKPPEYYAKSKSEIISWIIFSTILVLFGSNFIPLDYQSLYSNFFSVVLIYSAIGSFVMQNKKIEPPPTEKINECKIDLNWGFSRLYWTVWWPMYLDKGGKSKN
jgi:hypothetical protein